MLQSQRPSGAYSATTPRNSIEPPNRGSNNETDMIAKKSETFEVTITGGDGLRNRRYQTFDDAKAAALRVLKFYDRVGTRAAHPAVIHGPDCGSKGKTIT